MTLPPVNKSFILKRAAGYLLTLLLIWYCGIHFKTGPCVGLPTRVVELHSYLLKDPKIKMEYLLIQKEQNRIAKGVF